MSDVDVKSENQSGGITAQNVNTGGGTQVNVSAGHRKARLLKTIAWWMFGLVGLLAAGLTIWKFFVS